MGYPGGSDSKESTGSVGGLGSIPGLGRTPGGGHDNPLHYCFLENPHGQRRLAGYSPQGQKESDMTERHSAAQARQINVKDCDEYQIYTSKTMTKNLKRRRIIRNTSRLYIVTLLI